MQWNHRKWNTAYNWLKMDNIVFDCKYIWICQQRQNKSLWNKPGRQVSAALQTQRLSRFNGISFHPSNSSSRINRSFNSNTYWCPVLGFCNITYKARLHNLWVTAKRWPVIDVIYKTFSFQAHVFKMHRTQQSQIVRKMLRCGKCCSEISGFLTVHPVKGCQLAVSLHHQPVFDYWQQKIDRDG